MSDDLKKGKWAEKGKFVDTIDEWAKHVLDVSPKVEKEVTDKLFSGKSLDTIDLLTGYCKDCSDKKKNLTANSSTDNKNIILAERDYFGGLTNTIDTIGDLLQRNSGVRNSLRTQQIKEETKTIGKELINNGLGNALRFLWKPQTYMPSWSKSVKDTKDTEDSMPKLLRKYGAYCFEYALADNERRDHIPNIEKMKQDIIQDYGNVKVANGDFYKLLTMLRKASLNDKVITDVINQDVTVTNFQIIRKNYEDLGEDKQQIFLDRATKKIGYILKYWNTTSRQEENEKTFIPDMNQVVKNISNLGTNVIINTQIVDSKAVKRFLADNYRIIMDRIQQEYMQIAIKANDEAYRNKQTDSYNDALGNLNSTIKNSLIMCAQLVQIYETNKLDVEGTISVIKCKGVYRKYSGTNDMFTKFSWQEEKNGKNYKHLKISIAQFIGLSDEEIAKSFNNIRTLLSQSINNSIQTFTKSGYDDYDEDNFKKSFNTMWKKIESALKK